MSPGDILIELFLRLYHMAPPLLMLAPPLALAVWARSGLHPRTREVLPSRDSRGPTGAEAAAALLEDAGVAGVSIVRADDLLTDYYDPARRELRLGASAHDGRHAADLGRALHEAGHALRHAAGVRGVALRTPLVFAIGLAATAAWLVFAAGVAFDFAELAQRGVAAFASAVAIGIILLPAELDANRRIHRALAGVGRDDLESDPALRRALRASCWANVAMTLPSGRR